MPGHSLSNARSRRCQRRRHHRSTRRRGAATVEFAFCVPIFFTLTLAGIEIARVNMMIQSVQSACVHGARRGMLPGATAEEAVAEAQQVLDIARIANATITISPDPISELDETLTISITAPMSDNGYLFPGFFGHKTVSHSVTLNRE
ncbi:MAG: pilus assembly protein [Planctomycetota bacterium]|nr:MAG: pilus assembly protein [Planctomycetota bacterium]